MRNSTGGLVAALLLSTALPIAAQAQDGDAVDGILACRSVVGVEARLACFDSAAARLAGDRESGELMTVTRGDVAAVEGDSFGYSMPSLPRLRMPSLAALAADRQHDALEGAAAPATNQTQSAPAAMTGDRSSTTTPPNASAAASAAPSAPEVTVTIVERTDDGGVFRVEMEIAQTRAVGYNTTMFYMTNGQVWRQTDSGRVRIPRGDNHVAEIRLGAMSSYLLRVNGEGRAIRVERVR